MRIVYCIDSINGTGGIQRVTVAKANALGEMLGYDVWIALADNSGERRFEPSPRVHIVDLAVNYYEDDWKSKLNVLKGIVIKRARHKKRLTALFKEIQPDVVISVGESEKFFLPTIRGPWARIREIHYTKDYRWKAAKSLFDKFLALGGHFLDYSIFIKRYDRIVVLTREDKEIHWKDYYKTVVIPNPVTPDKEGQAELEAKKVVAVGRLVRQKNFSSLIQAYRKVADRHPDWRLGIIGDGPERDSLQALIGRLSLAEYVTIKKSTKTLNDELLSSSILAMSSLFEGFGLVLVEAMQLGVPVVSYACPCGPKDIITDGEDGLLIPPGDESALADGLCRLIEDEPLRKRMGAHASVSSKRFSLDAVMKLWVALFNQLSNKNDG